jgi:hypothetical protein
VAVRLIILVPYVPAVSMVVPFVLLPNVPIVVPVSTATPPLGWLATLTKLPAGKLIILKIK